MSESTRDLQAYNRFRQCVWDEFVIPDTILEGPPPDGSSKYRLGLSRPQPEPVGLKSSLRGCQVGKRFFGLFGLKRHQRAVTSSECKNGSGVLGGQQHFEIRLGLGCTGTIRAGLRFRLLGLGHGRERRKPRKAFTYEQATLTTVESISETPPVIEALEPHNESSPEKETPSNSPPTLETLPVEILQEIFVQTSDPYSMVCLSLASRHLLRVAAGMKESGTVLPHPCIDGSLSHMRKYHNHAVHASRSGHYRTPSTPHASAAADARILDFLTRVGPPVSASGFSNVCINCRKWKTTDYETSIERAKKSGTQDMVIEGIRREVTPEAYVMMWQHKPEAVGNFCPECLEAKAMKRDKEKEEDKNAAATSAGAGGDGTDNAVVKTIIATPVKGRRYRRARRRGGDS